MLIGLVYGLDMAKNRRTLVLIVLALLAAACGGGGADPADEVVLPDDATTTITTVTTVPLAPDSTTTTTTVPAELALDGVWFAPVPPQPAGAPPTLPDGSEDYWQLFEDPDAWRSVAARIEAVKIHGWMFRFYFTDEQVETIIAGLDDLGLPLVVEMEPLPHPDPAECEHGESFEGPFELDTLRRIARLGGTVDAIAIEQPHTFATLLDEPGSCRYPLERTLEEVVKWIDEARTIFPDVPVGSIEGVWDWSEPEDFAVWLDAYEARSGEPFAFIHVDPFWTRDDWPEVVREIEKIADARDVPFGLLYNGLVSEVEPEWLPLLAERVVTYEERFDGSPDHGVLQSWDPWPDRVLPSDDIEAFTHMIGRYLAPRVSFSDVSAADGTGRLVTSDGDPAVGLAVEGRVRAYDDRPQTITLRGVVPESAEVARVLLRVNTEDAIPGDADIVVHDVVFREDGGDDLVPNGSFASGLSSWAVYGEPVGEVRVVDDVLGPALSIDARPDQPTQLDGAEFVVTPGAEFELVATFGAPVASADTATISVGFFSGGSEFERRNIFVGPVWQTLATAVSDADGRFSLSPSDVLGGVADVELATPGDLTRLPASVSFAAEG